MEDFKQELLKLNINGLSSHTGCGLDGEIQDIANATLSCNFRSSEYHYGEHLDRQAKKSGLSEEIYLGRSDLSHIASSYDDFYD